MAHPSHPRARQPPQEQYYDDGGATYADPRQPAGYDNRYYDNRYDAQCGYDQQQYEQWDNGYDYRQQQGYDYGYEGYQQQHPQYDDRRRQPPQAQGRGWSEQQQYEEEMYQEQAYNQPQRRRRVPANRPMGPSGGPQGSMRRLGGRPPNAQQEQAGRKPQLDRSLLRPASPKTLPQDNPFPTFPSKKAKQSPDAEPLEKSMAQMKINEKGKPREKPPNAPQERSRGESRQEMRNHGPPPGYVSPDGPRQDSGHFEGGGRDQRPPPGAPSSRGPPRPLDLSQGPPPNQYNPATPTQRTFGPNTQRSVTMPHNIDAALIGRGYQAGEAQRRAEPGPPCGYVGPDSPTYVPPRPSTASGSRQERHERGQQYEQGPPIPQPALERKLQAHQQHQQKSPMSQPPPDPQSNPHEQFDFTQDDGHGDLDNLYDDYYGGNEAIRRSKASSIDMPDFDAIPEANTKHRRGDSIDNHLGLAPPDRPPQAMAGTTDGPAEPTGPQYQAFNPNAARSQAQPEVYEQYDRYDRANAPPRPPPETQARQTPPVGLPSGPRGRGPPPRGMTTDGLPQRRPSDPMFSQGQEPPYDPRYQPHQPSVYRGYSDQSVASEPGPNARRIGSPMHAGSPILRPGTAAPAVGRMPSDIHLPRRAATTRPMNPDALPAHPAPVRAGLMQQEEGPSPPPQQKRPPPVRHYNTEPSPSAYRHPQSPPPVSERRTSEEAHPVTFDELNRLRNMMKVNPANSKAGLELAKKLIEASNVLIDEGGTADKRTQNKNREKFVLEAHKTIKKLVQNGSSEAMFFLADCYGAGKLGLQPDAKEAFSLYQSAAKAGHAASAYRTAVCCELGHEEGGGTKHDPLKAVQWYRRAAALGETAAMYKMGMILLKGLLGQQKNLGEAINMLKRAADRADKDNPHALHELALLYEAQTNNERIIRDEEYAAQLFLQAAELGYKFSQFRLGEAYEYGLLGYPIDASSSIAWYTRAASQEEHQAELALSGWYLTGSKGILEQSDTEAYLWARKAACAEPPLPKALFAMGYFTEVGIGCPRSLEEAKRWYGRAAAYKYPKAQERLEELKKGGAKVQRSRERLSRTDQKQHDENCNVM
ncbi:hypothetical protein M011DRAFT_399346 [Sporormia fimetaria CBS 119925]|uniref:HCP-like protein n=1 Tax=Sporormia fimetaria CBS 119925 TaxID=1340428 RepID=A0A6A6VEQ6_9PLEO|nr:hypothetical protein M011DRAFT_399346 [Sporormia fimetaria CBS 119925]